MCHSHNPLSIMVYVAVSQSFMQSASLRCKLANLKVALVESMAGLEQLEHTLFTPDQTDHPTTSTFPPWAADKRSVVTKGYGEEREGYKDDGGEEWDWHAKNQIHDKDGRLKYGPDSTPCRGAARWVSRSAQNARTAPYVPNTKYLTTDLTCQGRDGDEYDDQSSGSAGAGH